MEFWYWYWSGIKKCFTLRWIGHPATEYFLAIGGTVGLTIYLPINFTSLWLILVFPVGATAIIHGLWRWDKRIESLKSGLVINN